METSFTPEATSPKQAAVSVEEDLLASRRLLQVISELLNQDSLDGDGPPPPLRLEALGVNVASHEDSSDATSLAS